MNALLRLLAALAWLIALAPCSVAAGLPVQTFQPDSMERIVAAHAGKPFVLMVWSLDCEYCAASFAALTKASRERHIAVVNIATDRADDAENLRLIRAKVAAAGLSSETWAFGNAPPERLRHAIDARWRGEMPRSYWYGSDGRPRAHSGVITQEVVERMLPR